MSYVVGQFVEQKESQETFWSKDLVARKDLSVIEQFYEISFLFIW